MHGYGQSRPQDGRETCKFWDLTGGFDRSCITGIHVHANCQQFLYYRVLSISRLIFAKFSRKKKHSSRARYGVVIYEFIVTYQILIFFISYCVRFVQVYSTGWNSLDQSCRRRNVWVNDNRTALLSCVHIFTTNSQLQSITYILRCSLNQSAINHSVAHHHVYACTCWFVAHRSQVHFVDSFWLFRTFPVGSIRRTTEWFHGTGLYLSTRDPTKLSVTGLCQWGKSMVTGGFPRKGLVTRKMFPFDDVIMVHEHHFIRQLGHATAQFVRFAFTGVLSDHIDIHSGEKPFACAMRGERFTHTKTVQPIYIFKFEIKNSTAIA